MAKTTTKTSGKSNASKKEASESATSRANKTSPHACKKDGTGPRNPKK